MKYWIVPSNDSIFRIGDAMNAHDGLVDWRMENNFSVGDVVFIYKAKPEQCIRYKMEVVKINIQHDDAFDQSECWRDLDLYYQGLGSHKYVRFKLLEEYADSKPSLKEMECLGLKGQIQSVRECPDYLLSFLLNHNNGGDENFDVDYPEDSDLYEGALIQVKANKYERNSLARKQCVESKGYKCMACGFDFVDMYGDIGKRFIHVHHLVPISSIGKEYKLDVEKDLAPVCPNCHYMLHRKNPPYTIEELKEMLRGNPVAFRKLKHVEDDINVQTLILRMLHANDRTSDADIQFEVIDSYGERYPGMSPNEWRHIIENYTRMARKTVKPKNDGPIVMEYGLVAEPDDNN